MNTEISIFWFRRDLRLDDNHGLYMALNSGKTVMPVFIFDTDILQKIDDKTDKRVDFIFQSLEYLNNYLKINYNSGIQYFYGKPVDVFSEITKKYKIQSVFCNEDYEPYAITRDKSVKYLLEENGVAFYSFKDQVVFHKDDIIKKDGKPYTVYTPYANSWLSKFRNEKTLPYTSENCLENLHQFYPQNFNLEYIGFNKTNIHFEVPRISENIISDYSKTRDFMSDENGTSHLGIHLRFGTISVRKLAIRASILSEPFLKELIWREFFMQILFHFPYIENKSFKPKYDNIQWENNETLFFRWCEGTTGFPLVDAGMRELNATGFMHNRARMITASFLVKHLLIDWRWGEAYFANKLLDFDLASNNGNWQWASSSGCDAAPYFRIFNPTEQQRKFDTKFKYIKKWVPEFGSKNYPKPIIDHTYARNRTLERFKKDLNEAY